MKLRSAILLLFLFPISVKAQSVDFAFSTMLMMNSWKSDFSLCENFRQHDKLKFMFQHDRTCYYKANFETSTADSVIVIVGGILENDFFSKTGSEQVKVVEYYHSFETAKNEYLKIFRQICTELDSWPKGYKFNPNQFKWQNDTSFMKANDCMELERYVVFKNYNILSLYFMGTIRTDILCRGDLYLLIITFGKDN